MPSNAVLVTFDDGYRSFYTNAYPILEQLNIPAVNFVITKNLDQPLHSRIPSLSREEIREMASSGKHIDFQCHTDSLHDKSPEGQALFTTRLKNGNSVESEQEYTERIIQDTNRCTAKLRELDERPVDAFAFPFGVNDAQSAALLQSAGIRYAFTTVPGIADRSVNPMQIPRINAGSPFVRANSLNNLIIRKLNRPQT
ncbi:polysaccharide deacetylase family protein [Paenibacillus allorhizosphaerae]|uniref:Poly-beta-1,6-N-acetyl-D-glucosamine N-deacetylase n=1 Tax=Paenibacillus allorhizosphaerae TaxID=2849866 RepID=A0ABN7TSM9_9BACL|nr:polysaccharide deacetylase family protein [Paenibacillus allorhizosphaerae]CAG7654198.1 Poly-beta-1,6-N-acetyl-D-glucosamine N-deacetylase [Paenibacillus allorhizosphaerae]